MSPGCISAALGSKLGQIGVTGSGKGTHLDWGHSEKPDTFLLCVVGREGLEPSLESPQADFKSACFCSLAFVIVRRYRNQASGWPGTVRGCSLTIAGVGVKIGVKVVARSGFIPARSSMSISVQGGRIATAFVSICPPISTDVYPDCCQFCCQPVPCPLCY